jgi:hypothetical protein
MTTPDTLPDLTHRWQATSGPSYLPTTFVCRDCERQSAANWADLCDERILAHAREQYAAGYRDGVRDAFAGRVALAANEADPTGPLIVVPVERMDEAAGPPKGPTTYRTGVIVSPGERVFSTGRSFKLDTGEAFTVGTGREVVTFYLSAAEVAALGGPATFAGVPITCTDLSRDPSQSESQPTPDRRPSRRTGSPAGGAPLPPDDDRNPDDEDKTP